MTFNLLDWMKTNPSQAGSGGFDIKTWMQKGGQVDNGLTSGTAQLQANQNTKQPEKKPLNDMWDDAKHTASVGIQDLFHDPKKAIVNATKAIVKPTVDTVKDTAVGATKSFAGAVTGNKELMAEGDAQNPFAASGAQMGKGTYEKRHGMEEQGNKDLRQGAGKLGENALNLAAILPTGKVVQGAAKGSELVAATKAGAKVMGGFGAAQGGAEALQQDKMSGKDLAEGVIGGGVGGAIIGGLTGGVVNVGSKAVSNVVSHVLANSSKDFKINYLMNSLQNLPKDAEKEIVPGMKTQPKPDVMSEVNNIKPVTAASPEALKSQFDGHATDFVTFLNRGDTEGAQQVMQRIATMQAPDDAKQALLTNMQTMMDAKLHVAEQHTADPSAPIAVLEKQVQATPGAEPNEIAGMRRVAKESGMNEQQYGNMLDARLKDLQEPVVAEQPGIPAEQQNAPIPGLKLDAPGTSRVSQGLQPAGSAIRERGEQIKTNSKNVTEERLGVTRNTPSEQVAADRNAADLEATLIKPKSRPAAAQETRQEPGKGSGASKSTSRVQDEPRPVVESKAGDPNLSPAEQASAAFSEGVESAKGKLREVTGKSSDASLHREKVGDNEHKVVNTATGETFAPKRDGSAVSELHNRFLMEKNDAMGATARDVTKVHGAANGGRAAGNELAVKSALKQLDKNLSKKDWEDLPHYLEGTLKDKDVSPALRANKQIFHDLDRLSFLIHKEARPGMGELGGIAHTRHIYEGEQDKTGFKGIFGKFSNRAGSQKARTVAKFMAKDGSHQVGTAEYLGLKPHGDKNVFVDKNGEIFHATAATLQEKLDAGLKYSTDGRKMFETQMREALKVHNTMSTVRELVKNPKYEKNIMHLDNGDTPPKGFVKTKIPGLEHYAVSEDFNKFIYTLADHKAGFSEKALNAILTPFDKVNSLAIKAFFTSNPLYHTWNVGGQALQAAGMDKSVVGAVKVAKSLGKINKEIDELSPDFIKYLDAGGSLGMHADHQTEAKSIFGKTYKAIASVVGAPLKYGGKITNRFDTVAKYANVKNLVEAKNMSWVEAVKKVDGIIGDYGNLSKFEKNVATRAVFFYPFFKIMIGSAKNTAVGVFKEPSAYAGVALNAALMFGAFEAINEGVREITGNKYASIRKPGNLGFLDSVLKAPSQINRGNIPSAISSRIPPAQKEVIEQIFKSGVLSDHKDFDSREAHALRTIFSQVAQFQDVDNSKKTPGEIALGNLGIQLPHGEKSVAAPNLADGPFDKIINQDGKYNSKTAAENQKRAEDFKDAGGSKLLLYQTQRISGDNSMDSFFSKNPQLDPKSDQFQGFDFRNTQQEKQGIQAGMEATKANGGSSLKYMQSIKQSGSTYYDKFFAEHPDLDPTSDEYVNKNGSGGSTGAKNQAKFLMSKAKSSSKPRVRVSSIGASSPTAKTSSTKKVSKITVPKSTTRTTSTKVKGVAASKVSVARKRTKAASTHRSLKKIFN